jgi:hypothetical protein
MTSIHSNRGHIERLWGRSAVRNRLAKELLRSRIVDSVELKSSCSWTATDFGREPCVDGSGVQGGANDGHDCQSVRPEGLAAGLSGVQS